MDESDPLIPRASIALLALVLLGASINKPASAKEVPKTITPTATVTPSPVIFPTPTATRTPEPTPTITQTPTPTLDAVSAITTAYIIDNVVIWLPEIERIIEWEELELDPILVLSVIAAESGGNWNLRSYANACGLMQVIVQPWYVLGESQICNSNVGNLYMGMYILRWSLDLAEKKGLPLEYGVAFYNCSYDGVMTDMCGTKGGLHYSDNVLSFWYPRFVLALEE